MYTIRPCSGCCAATMGFRKTLPKAPEDRIEASVVGLAEDWSEDIDRLSNILERPITAVTANCRIHNVRAEGNDAVFRKSIVMAQNPEHGRIVSNTIL